MERFAFKIDAALKANLYKICRLCGIDNPTKVKILPNPSDIIDLDEPTLCRKVFELVGFMVEHNDKMPQTMCSLCVDKINDFYEFREMCYATNDQTRKLLGLKQSEPQKLLDVKPIIKSEPQTINKRGRKRKTDETSLGGNSSTSAKSNATEVPLDVVKNEPISWRKKLRLQQLSSTKTEVKDEPTDVDLRSLSGRKARKASCSVCGERFESKEIAEEHKSTSHVPTVMRYFCHACNQSHHNPSDIKAHQLWHKLSKTPYKCPRCDVNVANNYAFTRHLREHTVSTPVELLVLDRVCPLCKKTFLTNYFYNTHPCARRTRKCGGCSCTLNSEIAYMRHAPYCAKVYLSYSKYIMPNVADHEAEVRIKNENDLEVEETEHSSINQDVNMQPFVVLERLSSPLLRTTAVSNSPGRSSDRVSSKKYLKRVDQLLKNTMSTLVSIKHEPEVHINDTGPQAESEPDDEQPPCDDFHAGNDDSDDDADGATEPAPDVPTVTVKQELIDEGYEKQHVKQEPLKLKLKITNNHGQLNSSIVDDDDNDFQQSKSAKKKKKRKHKERNKETEEAEQPTDETQQVTPRTGETPVATIKQERVDESYADNSDPQTDCQPMTSIPLLQLDNHEASETEDVKPNRLELDRLMQITHIASGVAMAEEALPPESAVEAVPNESPPVEMPIEPNQQSSTKSTARKSTGRAASTSKAPQTTENQLPKIVSIESGATVPFNMIDIKPEPANSGYADEQVEWAEQDEAEPEQQPVKSNHNEKMDEETSYINSLDLSNVVIKQEHDLHISDININGSEPDNMQSNGLRESADEDDDDDDDDEDSASSADEAEENMDTYDEHEVRIYQEIELPLLEEQSPVKPSTAEAQPEQEPPPESLAETASDEMPAEAEGMHMEQAPNGLLETKSPNEPINNVATLENDLDMIEQETTPEATVEQEPNTTSEEQEISTVAPAEEEETPKEGSREVKPAVEPQEPSSNAFNEQHVESQFMLTNVLLQPDLDSMEPQNFTADEPPPNAEVLEPPVEHHSNLTESQVPQLEMVNELQESQLATTSAFSFVITSVCSQADEALSTADEPPHEAAEKCEEDIISAPKDVETLAQPFFNNPSPNYNCDEEQQNVLNHELSSSVHQVEIADDQQFEDEEAQEQQLELEAGSSTANCSDLLNNDYEETENRINEQQLQQELQQEQQQPQQPQQQPQPHLRYLLNDDDSNINEIAENNNNANIERELNEDANALDHENPIT